MLQQMIPKTIATRTYIITTALITLVMAGVGYLYAEETECTIILDHERQMTAIASALSREVYARELQGDFARVYLESDEAALAALRDTLQPVVSDMARQQPGFNLGVSLYDRRVAFHPFRPDGWEVPVHRPALAVYDTKVMTVIQAASSSLLGQTTMTVIHPLFSGGRMVGHTWSSVAVSVLNETVFVVVLRIILALIAAWAGLMIILYMAFADMRRSLGELAKHILRQEDHTAGLEKFPELKPVIAAVTTLRKGLKESENQYRTLLENSPDAIFRYDTACRLVYANPATRQRHPGIDLMGKRPREFGMVSAATADLVEDAINTVLATGENVERCYPLPTRDGRQRYMKASWIAEMDDRGRVVSVLGISRDVTELQTANERFSTLFNLNPNILVLTRKAEGAIIDVNRVFLEKSGLTREEAIGHHGAELGLWLEAGQQQELIQSLNRDGRLSNCEIHCTVRGQAYTGLLSSAGVSINGEACWLHVVTDITDKKKIDAELARLESFNLVGEMAASIGHEVRNPMTTVRGYLQMFQRKAAFAPYAAQLSLMIEEIDRANSIITEFLSLAKNKATVMKQGNLNSILNTLEPLLQADVLRWGHQLNISTTPIPDTVFDENELRQLILNLFRNAMEAMDLPGVVSIRTYDAGDAVILSVNDTGRGVAPDIMARLGTPFLTTKEQGTGLGLAVCYRIAQRHDARITVHTTPGGTTFAVKFKPSNDK